LAAFYANENFPRQGVEALRALGHDVLTTHEAGRSGRAVSDEDVLAFAAESRRTVLTLNRRDFIRLHKRVPNHAGIVVCTHDPDPVEQAARIHEAVRAASDLAGLLLRVNRPNK
jgi:hypothetical protein